MGRPTTCWITLGKGYRDGRGKTADPPIAQTRIPLLFADILQPEAEFLHGSGAGIAGPEVQPIVEPSAPQGQTQTHLDGFCSRIPTAKVVNACVGSPESGDEK